MYTKQVVIQNKTGLHARPATQVAYKSKEFKSDLWLEFDNKRANLKSMVSILAAGIKMGVVAQLCAEGEDEQDACECVAALIASLVE